MKNPVKSFRTDYIGYESFYDALGDIEGWFERAASKLPAEFTGTFKVTITYHPDET